MTTIKITYIGHRKNYVKYFDNFDDFARWLNVLVGMPLDINNFIIETKGN